ncbi:disease resistance protein RGA2-like [Ziziphus jujuba]|uniref:Disease resistance protein RGA2-like n=1 Tax=Ziziphus jujuba TaxID=326968 RepID=A0ABM4A639_ZIZJJ|nr:disease resistance protein RGA2-like [Ziziphus jujuba]
MAEALLSAVLGQLFSIVTELGNQELRLVKDVEKSISNLQKKLEHIQDVLEDAERKQLDDPSVRRWLGKLKHVSYAINDVLDDWNSEILKSQLPTHVEEEEGDGHQKADLVSNKMMMKKKKVCFPSPSCFFCLNQLKKVGVRHGIALRMKELNETLDEIAKEKDAYSLEKTNNASPKERRETTSFVYESDVDGRDEDKNLVISKLLSDESSDKVPVIIPIVGMGGLGKTTLAQLVFNHEKIKTHFNERIWVCVSDPFDEVRIAKAIFESLNNSRPGSDRLPDSDRLEVLSQHIRTLVNGKKFLLVLDDVWSDDREKWEKLIQPLRCGAVRSRVLVTTRKTEVAHMMGVTSSQIIYPDQLSEDHCWKIIKRLAFEGRNGEELKQQLEEVGKEIAKKCKGLPLVAKTLGGLLFSKQTLKEWEDVLSSKLWELQDEQSKTFAPFFLSYNDLSPRQKRCFSYCSVFPKDFKIERSNLIEMWMSQGYLSGSPQDMEKEGEKCFQILTMRSFFQDFERDVDGNIYSCKMHDILHDFSQYLTKNECSTMKVDMEDIEPLSVEKVRHFTLQTLKLGGAKFPTSTFHQNNLHTLFLNCSSSGLDDDDDYDMLVFLRICCDHKHLRTLYLEKCRITNIPEQLGQLIHLRYLNLSGNSRLRALPDEVCDLCNLQTLRIQYCRHLQRLPKGMGKLVNLRHLYCFGCYSLEGLPKGIGRLTELRILDRMIIPENNEAYLSLGDLKKLNHLQSHQTDFEIFNCHNLISMGENKERVLMNWKYLVHLRLSFKRWYRKICEDEFGILETLQPHRGLKRLSISSYFGTNLCPEWMVSLVHLKTLSFFHCLYVEKLPPLGSLPSLEELRVSVCNKVRKIGVEFLGNIKHNNNNNVSFPKLKLLDFSGMENWEEWEGNIETTEHTDDAAGGAIIMPRLDSLQISSCFNLKSLPEYLKLTPLKNLSILWSNMLWQSLAQSEKEWLKISHIPNIEIGSNVAIRRDGKWNYDELARLGVPRAFVHDGNEEDPF